MKTERKIYYFNYFDKKVPMIRLIGQYLSNYGLNIGDKVRIEIKYNQITITKI